MRLQRGGFVMGLIVGLLVGLALALGVALYVTKVPVPFVNKVPQRTAEQDAAEAEKNKNWDPNSPLYGKNPARPNPAAVAASGTVAPLPPVVPPPIVVQAGAFARPEDADQQRAKLAMLGMTAKVTEREQAGRTVYRVRLGPFDKKEEADATKEKLDGSGVESALVRVQR